MEEPAGGPNFLHFGENIRYEIHIDNDGDGVEDITYRFLFTRHVRRGDTYTYNDGPIAGVDAKAWGNDPQPERLLHLQRRQDHRALGQRDRSRAITRIGDGLLELPNNVGPKSFPDGYETATGAGRRRLHDGQQRPGLRGPAPRSVLRGPRA